MSDQKIDVADCVRHGPTCEEWVVAAVDGDKLYWCGYPFGGYADLSDCTLTHKATEEKCLELLQRLAVVTGNARPKTMAIERLAKLTGHCCPEWDDLFISKYTHPDEWACCTCPDKFKEPT